MRYILPFINLIFITGSIALARFLGNKKEWARLSLIVCLIGIGFFIFFGQNSTFIQFWTFTKIGIFFHKLWIGWIAIIFLTVASERISNEREKRAIRIFLIFVILTLLVYSIWFLFPVVHPHQVETFVNSQGVAIQSTYYTCGSASLVTLLHEYGIDTTELEMARLSYTRAGLGTDEIGVYYALKNKLKDSKLNPHLERMTLTELKGLDEPVIISTEYNFLVDHFLVVLGSNEDKFKVADPSQGLKYLSEEQLRERWKRIAIYVR